MKKIRDVLSLDQIKNFESDFFSLEVKAFSSMMSHFSFVFEEEERHKHWLVKVYKSDEKPFVVFYFGREDQKSKLIECP